MRKIREKLSGRPLLQPQPPKGTPAISSATPPQPSRPPHQAPPPPSAPVLTISPAALATLTWAAQRSQNECCLWGVLGATDEGGLRLEEAILARHRAAPAWCAPDMSWYGDLLWPSGMRSAPWSPGSWPAGSIPIRRDSPPPACSTAPPSPPASAASAWP